jgi:hypothetical protein
MYNRYHRIGNASVNLSHRIHDQWRDVKGCVARLPDLNWELSSGTKWIDEWAHDNFGVQLDHSNYKVVCCSDARCGSMEVHPYPHIAVIVPWFQPVKTNRPLANMLMLLHTLETAGMPYYISELAADGEPFEFDERPNVFHFR